MSATPKNMGQGSGSSIMEPMTDEQLSDKWEKDIEDVLKWVDSASLVLKYQETLRGLPVDSRNANVKNMSGYMVAQQAKTGGRGENKHQVLNQCIACIANNFACLSKLKEIIKRDEDLFSKCIENIINALGKLKATMMQSTRVGGIDIQLKSKCANSYVAAIVQLLSPFILDMPSVRKLLIENTVILYKDRKVSSLRQYIESLRTTKANNPPSSSNARESAWKEDCNKKASRIEDLINEIIESQDETNLVRRISLLSTELNRSLSDSWASKGKGFLGYEKYDTCHVESEIRAIIEKSFVISASSNGEPFDDEENCSSEANILQHGLYFS